VTNGYLLLIVQFVGSNTVYFMEFDVHDNTVAAFSSTENKIYRFEQKTKEQQLALIGSVEEVN
jgi:hypothetical protein